MGKGLDARARGGEHRSVRTDNILLHGDRRIEQPCPRHPGGLDAGHRFRRLQALARPGFRFLVQARAFARAFEFDELLLDPVQQVRLGDPPRLAQHAQVPGRHGHRRIQHTREPHRRDCVPAAKIANAHHGYVSGPANAVSRGFRPTGFRPTGSGPTSGPSSPNQGRSGSANARPRIRSRATGPISA